MVWTKSSGYKNNNDIRHLDFLSFHPYPVNTAENEQNQFFYKGQLVGKYELSEKDFISKIAMKVRKQLKTKGFDTIEIHVTEWNSNVQWDYVNDTAFKAPFLVENSR